MMIGDRVRIKSTNPYTRQPDRSPFAGCTGRVVDIERNGRTRMYHVALDRPVDVPGVGLVGEDFCAAAWLSKIRSTRR